MRDFLWDALIAFQWFAVITVIVLTALLAGCGSDAVGTPPTAPSLVENAPITPIEPTVDPPVDPPGEPEPPTACATALDERERVISADANGSYTLSVTGTCTAIEAISSEAWLTVDKRRVAVRLRPRAQLPHGVQRGGEPNGR